MPDHMNINHPDLREKFGRRLIENEKLKAEISALSKLLVEVQDDLDSIFTRIRNGDPVELHYPDGTVLIAVKGRARRGDDDSPDAAT